MIGKPNLQHSELKALYQNDFSIPSGLLKEILQLPKVSLIEDLEEILEDAIRNYEFYEHAFDEKGDENKFLAPAHAIFLLGELKAIESLPKLEYFFSQDEVFVDFWMGDLLTEELWLPFYKLAEKDILRLLPFIKKLGVDVYSKSPFAEAAFLHLVFRPEQKENLLPVYKELLYWLIDKAQEYPDWNDHNDNLSNIVWDIIRNQTIELKPEVEVAIKANLVDELEADQWETAVAIFQEENDDFNRVEITIFEQYEELVDNYSFTENNEHLEFLNAFLKTEEEQKEEDVSFKSFSQAESLPHGFASSIIQEGACPCGSGEKYIACCLKQLN